MNNISPNTEADAQLEDFPQEEPLPRKGRKKNKRPNAVYRFLDRYFRFTDRGTNIKTEIFAGILMFAEVIVFIMVNALLISSSVDDIDGGFTHVYFAMILVSAITTVAIGLLCNAPFVQSVSLGMTSLILSLIGTNAGLTYANVMAIALISNLIYFVVMIVKPARKFIFNAVPEQVRKALPAALGAFLVFYALVQLNVFSVNTMDFTSYLNEASTVSSYTISQFAINFVSFNLDFDAVNFYGYMPAITAIIAFAVVMILKSFKIKHATIITFGGVLLLYLIIWVLRDTFSTDYQMFAFFAPAYGGMYYYSDFGPMAMRLFDNQLLFSAFKSGFDFSGVTEAGGNVFVIFLTSIVAFLVLGVSETGATVAGHAYISGHQDEAGRPLYTENGKFGKFSHYSNVYAVNALSSVFGCLMGTGPVVARPESVVGADEGGRTGLSAVVAGLLFIPAIFILVFSGLLINGMVVYGLLIYVGLTMLTAFKKCDFSSVQKALPFISTVAVAALTLNMATAIAIGVVMDTLLKCLTFKIKTIKSIKLGTWVLTAFMIIVLVFGFIF